MIKSPTSRKAEPSESLANLMKAQYLSREFNDVFASTELRDHEIPAFAGAMACRFVSLIMTYNPRKYKLGENWKDDLDETTIKRVELCELLLNDPNSMVFAMEDAYLYAFGVCRQSLDRKSRSEGVVISTAHTAIANEPKRISLPRKILNKLTFRKEEDNIVYSG